MKGLFALAVVGAALVSAEAQSQWIAPVRNAMRESKPIIDIRVRAESVDQAGMAHDAAANTLRGRFGFDTGRAWNTSFLAEADLLWNYGDNFNSTVNGHTAWPIVADPETHEINRFQLTYTSIPGTTLV